MRTTPRPSARAAGRAGSSLLQLRNARVRGDRRVRDQERKVGLDERAADGAEEDAELAAFVRAVGSVVARCVVRAFCAAAADVDLCGGHLTGRAADLALDHVVADD